MTEDIRFHAQRAMAELDLALRVGNVEAAKAHFTLSTLHLDRMCKLSRAQTIPADQA